jgi:hypothetical protein
VTWLSAIAATISLVSAIVGWLERSKQIDAALSAAILKSLREADESIAKAEAARAAVRDDIKRNPDKLHDDDGFRRD